MTDINNILSKFGANAIVEQNCFTLCLEMMNQHFYADRYPKAFDVCHFINFQSIDDVETYIEKATNYIAEYYKIDLDYSIHYWDEHNKNKGAVVRIYDDKSVCFIEGRVDCIGIIKVFSFD